ncbi:hypothetical protein DPMN_180563 [Dreissena polymorpha]|uniref:Uncharacterized protein n=1 Tax=Dreissena polymorpha TaxID=45954 RepID=A0A9D4EH44_DREPO|nr:hypothetical protein DPMN_180563 [Dreissena polymorpha]
MYGTDTTQHSRSDRNWKFVGLLLKKRNDMSGKSSSNGLKEQPIGINMVEHCDMIRQADIQLVSAKAEQTYFAIRGGKAKRVDAASVVEAASVCGGKSHFAAKLRICPPRHAAVRDMMPIDDNQIATSSSAEPQSDEVDILD